MFTMMVVIALATTALAGPLLPRRRTLVESALPVPLSGDTEKELAASRV